MSEMTPTNGAFTVPPDQDFDTITFQGSMQQVLQENVGKYVIVDFSASWCGPCKAEMPNLARIYDTYKGDKFDMVTVMVWDKLEASKKMLEEYHVNWQSILNVGMKPMKLYGFSCIPRIMLFAPDGTIVHNELRGDLMENKVKEILGK